jgi:hypothetical protein
MHYPRNNVPENKLAELMPWSLYTWVWYTCKLEKLGYVKEVIVISIKENYLWRIMRVALDVVFTNDSVLRGMATY